MAKRLTLVAAAVLACGCSRTPSDFPIPMQRGLSEGRARPDFGAYLKSGEKQFDAQTVSGMIGKAEGSNFRWTTERLELRFFLDRVDNLQFVLHGGLNEASFKKAKEVKVRVLINNRPFLEHLYRAAGGVDFTEPVGPELLQFGENRVVLEINPPIVAEQDGVKLGCVLNEVGFMAR